MRIDNKGAYAMIKVGYPTRVIFHRRQAMSSAVREYDAKIDSKKRLTLRNIVFEYYHVKEMSDGVIILEFNKHERNDSTHYRYLKEK